MVVAGETSSFGSGGKDGWLAKLDANGGLLWQNAIGGSADDSLNSVVRSRNGGYLGCGYTKSFGNTAGNAWVIKFDESGSVQWQKSVGVAGVGDECTSVIEASDGGIIFTGNTHLTGSGSGTGLLMAKLMADGSLAWYHSYRPGSTSTEGRALALASDGSFLVTGVARNGFLVVHSDTGGNPIWVNTYGTGATETVTEEPNAIIGGVGGKAIAVGYSRAYSKSGFPAFWVIKTQVDGALPPVAGPPNSVSTSDQTATVSASSTSASTVATSASSADSTAVTTVSTATPATQAP